MCYTTVIRTYRKYERKIDRKKEKERQKKKRVMIKFLLL